MRKNLRLAIATLMLAGLGVFAAGCNTGVDNTAETPEYEAPGAKKSTENAAVAPNPPPPDTP